MNKNFSRIIDESISHYLTQNIITEKKSKKDSKKEDDKDEDKGNEKDDEDGKGQFSIERKNAGDFIHISSIGYGTKNLPVSAFTTSQTINLILASSNPHSFIFSLAHKVIPFEAST